MTDFGIPSDTITEITNILNRYPEIYCAKIFGSRAMGNYKRYSDIDIAIFAPESQYLCAHVKDEIDDLYVIYTFDIVHYQMITNEALKSHIQRVGKTIHGLGENTDEPGSSAITKTNVAEGLT